MFILLRVGGRASRAAIDLGYLFFFEVGGSLFSIKQAVFKGLHSTPLLFWSREQFGLQVGTLHLSLILESCKKWSNGCF